MNPFARAVVEIARKEFMQHMRTKRVLIMGGLMALLLFAVTLYFGPNIVREFQAGSGTTTVGGNSAENLVLAFYFGLGIIGGLSFTILLAIVLTADAVCSEWSSKTIFLLLSKPVSRDAFVLGKFLGNVITITAVIVSLFSLVYLLMQFRYDGSPSGSEVGAFLLTLFIVCLGASCFAAMALFFSTIFKSTIMSMLVSLGMWLIVFPLVGQIGFFTNLSKLDQRGVEYGTLPEVQAWLYLNPASDMQAVATLLVPNDNGSFTEFLRYIGLMSPAPQDAGMAIFALLAYTALFLVASLLVVRRRNFE